MGLSYTPQFTHTGQNYWMLIGLDRGHFFLIFLQWRAKLLDPDWPSRQNVHALDWSSAPFLYLVGFLKSFVQNFVTRDRFKFLTFKPTYSVEKHGNQAIAWRGFNKGEPKASHTDGKRIFMLKTKTLERLGAFVNVWLKKFACCGQVPRLSSLHYGFLHVRRTAS